MANTTTKLGIICIICAAIFMGGCIDETHNTEEEVYVEIDKAVSYKTLIDNAAYQDKEEIATYLPPNDPIDNILNDIINNDVANKDHYSHNGGAKDVHVCGNMACEQAEWIEANYEYDVGITLLWSKFGNVGHAQTWVIIDDERYILESVHNEYWNESVHKDKFGDEYKICFNTIKKGKEHTKSSSEYTRIGKI